MDIHDGAPMVKRNLTVEKTQDTAEKADGEEQDADEDWRNVRITRCREALRGNRDGFRSLLIT